MKKGVFVILLFNILLYAQSIDSVTFSEIMFKPDASNSEFIELFNYSENTNYDLSGYHFKYHTSNPDSLIVVSSSHILAPHRFALVLEGDYDFQNGLYSIPDSIVVLTTADNAFGSSGMSNSYDRTVRLFNADFDTLSVYTYSANNASGISDEKIIPEESNSAENWANSLWQNGSPGIRNSRTPYDYDLSAVSLDIAPGYLTVADSLIASLSITNSGLRSAQDFSVSFYYDLNNDSTGEESELFHSENISSLPPYDSLRITAYSIPPDTGNYSVIAEILFDQDENSSDNLLIKYISVFPPKPQFGNIVINEIQYEPVTGEPEWVELQNETDSTIFNLKNWRFADKTSRPFITEENIFLAPKNFIILASDDGLADFYDINSRIIVMNLPTLNNSGDNLKLTDSLDTVIDSVDYLASWNHSPKHFSLERISASGASSDSNNWSGSVNPSRATPGFVNSVTRKDYDILLDSIFYQPENALAGEDVTLWADIKNIGKNEVSFALELNLLTFADSIPVSNLETLSLFLAAGDSVTVNFSPFQLTDEPLLLSVKIISDDDRDTTNNSGLINIFPSYSTSSLIINEVQFAPANGEPEWFELENVSDSPVNLVNWRMSDLLSVPHTVTISDSFFIVQPHNKLVISKDSSIYDYHESIPSELIVTAFPNLSNSEDGVVIRDANGKTIDSLRYSSRWGGRNGKSLERILSFAPTADSANWGSSTDGELGTPGRINSITPFDKNLAAVALTLSPDYITVSDTASATAKIRNAGLTEISGFSVKFYNDKNLDSLIEENELFAESDFAELFPGDTANLTANFFPSDTGKCRLFAVLNFPEDENRNDNAAAVETFIFPPKPKYGDVVINEIAYHPTQGQPEWIELYNRTDSTIFNLRKWRIADRTSSIRITLDTVLFYPHSFAVLCPTDTLRDFFTIDSGLVIVHLPSLNNSDDDLRLIDSMGTVIDSVYYKSNWNHGTEFSSLEKISPKLFGNDSASWKGCVNPKLGTPGMINSVTQKDYDIKITDLFPQPEMPYFRENFNLKCRVKNIGKNPASFTISLFKQVNDGSPHNILIETLSKSLFAGDSAVFTFATTFEANSEQAFTANIFFPQDEDTSNNHTDCSILPAYRAGDIKINEVHYAPIEGEPEWVELQNCSGDSLNLKNWRIGDVLLHPTFTQISDSDYFLPGNGKIVIAKDSAILDYHRSINSKLLVETFANLNNDADGIVIRDGKNNLIDSLLFHSAWGDIAGASLERKFANAPTNDSTNWGSSTDIELSTPGRKNSISPKNYNLEIVNLSFEPEFPDSGEQISINAQIKNIGNSTANDFNVIFSSFDMNARSYIPFGEKHITELNLLDSLLVTEITPFAINDSLIINVKCDYPSDEDTTDNSYNTVIKTGISEHALTFNEIMINPVRNLPEWCEIYNNGKKQINLGKVFICDSSKLNHRVPLVNSDYFLNKNSYFVITQDSSFSDSLNRLGIAASIADFGSLGNSHDALFLFDFRGNLIDSLCWNSKWKIVKGKSLEKLSPDSENLLSFWFPSLDSAGATPGRINSVSDYDFSENHRIAINEIMFSPASSNSEYVEITNYGEEPVEIGGWEILNSSGKSSYLCDKEYKLAPGKFFLFASDSNIFSYYGIEKENVFIPTTSSLSFGNNEDDVVIKDFRGNTIDSLHYYSKWHNSNFTDVNNRSLERISPSVSSVNSTNWSSCVNSIGGTPLSQNSIYLENAPLTNEITISPNPFSPDNDGFEDFTIIKFTLAENIAEIRIRIYDSTGRLVRTLIDNFPSGTKGEIIFDGKRETGEPLRMGIYILLIEEIASGNKTVKTFKKALVIARKL